MIIDIRYVEREIEPGVTIKVLQFRHLFTSNGLMPWEDVRVEKES